VNSGIVIAGDAGFANRREYTIVGPDVTLAHRLQAATFDLNAYIVASRATVEPVEDLYNLVRFPAFRSTACARCSMHRSYAGENATTA